MLLKELAGEYLNQGSIQHRINFTKNEKMFFDHIQEDLEDLKNEFQEHGYDEEGSQILRDAEKPPYIINMVPLSVFENQPISLKELIKLYKKDYPIIEDPDDIEQYLDNEISEIVKKSFNPNEMYQHMIDALYKRYVKAFKLDGAKFPKNTIMVSIGTSQNIKKLKKELKKQIKHDKFDDVKNYWRELSKLVLDFEDEDDKDDILSHIVSHHFNPMTTHVLNHVISLKNDPYSLVEYHRALNNLKHQLTDDYMKNINNINDILLKLKTLPKDQHKSPQFIGFKNKINELKHQNHILLHVGGKANHLSLSWVDHYTDLQNEYEKTLGKDEYGKLNELSRKLNPISMENNRLKSEIFKLFDKMLIVDKIKSNESLLHSFTYYKKMRDYDYIDGKHLILLVDDMNKNIDDIVKALYFCSIKPSSIMGIVV